MDRLLETLEVINEREYKVSNGKLNQVERNTTKAELMEALASILPEGLVLGKAKEGLVLEIPNVNEGAITVVLDIKIKALNFDGPNAVEDYILDKAEKAVRAEQRKRDRQAEFRNAEAQRKAKAKSKETREAALAAKELAKAEAE